MTGRKAGCERYDFKGELQSPTAGMPKCCPKKLEGRVSSFIVCLINSLNRGDRTPIELFVAATVNINPLLLKRLSMPPFAAAAAPTVTSA